MKNDSYLVDEIGINVFYVVSVYDELTKTFFQPWFGGDLEDLKRIFFSQIKNTPVWKDNPTDFSLYQLGYFNQDTGEMISAKEKITSGYIINKEN